MKTNEDNDSMFKKDRMSLLRDIWRGENGASTEARRVSVAFMPVQPTMSIRVDDVLRCYLHAVQCTTNCRGRVFVVPHGCPDVLVLRDGTKAIG